MRKIGVITTSRAEYGILRPVLRQITKDADLSLQLFVSGAHLSPEFGNTWKQIEYPITERIESQMSSDTPTGISMTMGNTMNGFAQAYERTRPDILLITGDRYEAAAAAMAALPFKIPVAHLGGGDITIGAFDDSLRHVITKLSHYHFAYAECNAKRIRQMGERNVWVTGNPAIDGIHESYGAPIATGALVVIFHPVTLEYERTDEYIDNLLEALKQCTEPIVFILPNADTAGRNIIKKMRRFCNWQPGAGAQAHANLVPARFYDLLRSSLAIIGNSSSGLMEAPSFGLPSVNIGSRQEGRLRGENVIDAGCTTDEILAGIRTATSPQFREGIQGAPNPYGDGHASQLIVELLKTVDLNVIEKEFHELS